MAPQSSPAPCESARVSPPSFSAVPPGSEATLSGPWGPAGAVQAPGKPSTWGYGCILAEEMEDLFASEMKILVLAMRI